MILRSLGGPAGLLTARQRAEAGLDGLIRALASDSVQAVIHRTARFNRHRDVILALLREPGIASLLLKSLFR